MSRFSIIIPVYNVEQYLNTCVQSVLAQTFTDFELILVDDGSKDTSGALCDELAQSNARIRVIHQENQGLSGARNTGINAATGDYLLFLDSDDWWASSDCLQKIADRLSVTNVDVLSFNYRKSTDGQISASYFDPGVDIPVSQHTLSAQTERGLWIACAWNKVVRRALFLKTDLLFRQGITSEDIDWVTRLAISASSFDFLNLCVVNYRQRSGSITHSVSLKAVHCHKNNILEAVRLVLAAPPEKGNALRSFIAYQYATLLFNYASLSKTDRQTLSAEIRQLLPWLQYSNNAKVRLIRMAKRFAGFRGAIALLSIKQRLG